MRSIRDSVKHERKKMTADLAERDALIHNIQQKFEAQEKMIEQMQKQCEKGMLFNFP